MANVNMVTLSGNLTRDPELRMTRAGLPVLAFSIAVNEPVKVSETEWDTRANFFDCTVFGKRGEGLSKFLKKGHKVCVSGTLRQERWEQDGRTRSAVRVICKEVDPMPRADAHPDQAPVPAAATIAAVPEPEVYPEDIPF